jgi:hypothetical protein
VAGADGAHVVERQLARQHDARYAKLLRQRDPLGAGDAHLRAAVYLGAGGDAPHKLRNAHILHDEGVSARRGDGSDRLHGGFQLVVEDQRVEGDVALHPAAMQRAHHLRQLVERKANLGARREMLEAEVDGVGACFDGGVELWPVAGRTHDFRFDG